MRRTQPPAQAGVRGIGATRDKGERKGELLKETEGVTGMRVGWQKKGVGARSLPRTVPVRITLLLDGDSLPCISPPPGELQLRAGVSLSVPTVKSGVALTSLVSHGRGIPLHTRQGVTCWRRGSYLPWASLRTTLYILSSCFQPTDWASVQDRCHRQRGLDQH